MYYKNIRLIELSDEELSCLLPIYKNMCCPMKCHTGEKRIWFIPKNLLNKMDNLEYTCCIYCYYNKSNMDLLGSKYAREDLQAVLCEDLSMNCDESENMNNVSIKLEDNFLLAAYKNCPKSKYTKIEKISSNNYNVYVDDHMGNISFILYKKILGTVNNNKMLFTKIYKDGFQKNDLDQEENFMLFSKIYPHENEYVITLDKVLSQKSNAKKNMIMQKPIKYNLYFNEKESLILEYSNTNDLININKIKINIISNKNYSKSLQFYDKIYEKKEIQI